MVIAIKVVSPTPGKAGFSALYGICVDKIVRSCEICVVFTAG